MNSKEQLDAYYRQAADLESVGELNESVLASGDLSSFIRQLILQNTTGQSLLLGIYHELVAARHEREASKTSAQQSW